MITTITKRKILIIDDEPGFTHMVRLTLENTGFYDVREENKPLLALSTAHEFKPDLIFLDVLMPDMDGGDVAAKLKADPEFRNTPVVFLTATVPKREANSSGGLTSGGFLFLAKPVGIKELVKCIEDNLKPAQQR